MKNKILFIFMLLIFSTSYNIAFSEVNAESTHSIISSKRYSDLDRNEFFYIITLANQQTFRVNVTLDELTDFSLGENTPVILLEESYEKFNPGFSIYKYQTLDGKFQFEAVYPSQNSIWKRDPESHPLVEVASVDWIPLEMGRSYYLARFSDGNAIRLNWHTVNNGVFKTGDQLFRMGTLRYVKMKLD